MKKKLLLLICICFAMCKSPKVEHLDYRPVSEGSVKKVLEGIDAIDSKFSVLVFTQGFKDERIMVLNDIDTVYNGTMKTIENLALAKHVRIDNGRKVKIKDLTRNVSFSLNKLEVRKYKYIYIDHLHNDRYTLNYSNNLKGFQ